MFYLRDVIARGSHCSASERGPLSRIQPPYELVSKNVAPGGGAVVNIHTNGVQVYAHEIYTLRHAVPGTYQVSLNVFPTSMNCTGATFAVPTATISNAIGNGLADFKFTPADVAAFRGMTFSINWTVVGPATYRTDCTVVALD